MLYKIFLIFSLPLLFISCNEDAITEQLGAGSGSGNGSTPGTEPQKENFVKIVSTKKVTSSNQDSFLMFGKCSKNNSAVKVKGSVWAESTCTQGVWATVANLSSLPYGTFKITLDHADVTGQEEKLVKDVYKSAHEAHYEFKSGSIDDDSSDNNHDAQTVTDVVYDNDTEKGDSVSFNGSTSVFQLNDGTFFNEAFSTRTYTMWIKPSDITTLRILMDEGGTTNAIGLKIESGSITAGTRSGGSGSQKEVSLAFTKGTDEWYFVALTFNKGTMTLHLDDSSASVATGYSSIPSHSDSGGLGYLSNGGAFGSSGDPFLGKIADFRVFKFLLRSSALQKVAGQTVVAETYDPIADAVVAKYSYNTGDSAVKDEKGNHQPVSQSGISTFNDSERGDVFEMDGASSKLQLDDGTFFNEEFETKTVGIWFYPTDLTTKQYIYEEGGATNGMSLVIKDDELILSTRTGGSGSQVDVKAPITVANKWYFAVLVYNKGTLKLFLGGTKYSGTTTYTKIATHGNDGGLGNVHGSSSANYDGTGTSFAGYLDDITIIDKALTDSEVQLFTDNQD